MLIYGGGTARVDSLARRCLQTRGVVRPYSLCLSCFGWEIGGMGAAVGESRRRSLVWGKPFLSVRRRTPRFLHVWERNVEGTIYVCRDYAAT